MRNRKRVNRRKHERTGGAVVEAALVLPVLIVLTLGVIDIAQYISLAQVVCNASRESARVASRAETDSISEIEAAAKQYFADLFPQLSSETLDAAIQIVVSDTAGNTITDLSAVESGTQLSAYLKFDFQTIRWLDGIDYWSGSADQATTVFRKE